MLVGKTLWFRLLLLFFLMSSLTIADAAKLYVLQNLKVHTEPSLESPVNLLLLGGEQVEVLRIDGDFTEVRSDAGQVGWVASEFLSDIKREDITGTAENPKNPEPVKKAEEAKEEKLTAKKTTVKKQAPKKTEQKKAVNQNTKKYTVKANTKTASSQKQNSQAKTKTDVNIISDSMASEPEQQSIKQIEDENRQLKEQLAQIKKILDISPSTGDSGIKEFFSDKLLWMLGAAVILGFILGILWTDFNIRRRHGGYKV